MTPNILIFMTDQQRWDAAPPFSRAKMPHLKKFAEDGVAFSQAFCPSPHCCPSRATFFTGLYPTEHGVWNNVQVANALSRGLDDGVRLFSEDLQQVGYNLMFSGKWHVSAMETPADRGFAINTFHEKTLSKQDLADFRQWPEWQQYRRLPDEESMERKPFQILRPGYGDFTICGVDESPFRDRETVDAAVEAIWESTDSSQPWCHFVGTLGPHDPYHVPQRFLDMYPDPIELPPSFWDEMNDKPGLYRRTRQRFDQLTEEEHREAIRHYLAFCSYEDELFGQVLAALDRSGQAENTLVVYLSDHGDYMAEHGLWAKGLPCFQSAYRVPAIVRWPKGIANPGRVVDRFVSLADFAPTFLEAAGLGDREFSGESLIPFLRDEEPSSWRDAIFTQSNGNELYGIQRSVLTENWKYVYNGFDFDELYDIQNDPHEMENLAGKAEYKPVVRQLMRRIWQFAYEHNDPCINPYIMVALAPYGPGIIFEDK